MSEHVFAVFRNSETLVRFFGPFSAFSFLSSCLRDWKHLILDNFWDSQLSRQNSCFPRPRTHSRNVSWQLVKLPRVNYCSKREFLKSLGNLLILMTEGFGELQNLPFSEEWLRKTHIPKKEGYWKKNWFRSREEHDLKFCKRDFATLRFLFFLRFTKAKDVFGERKRQCHQHGNREKTQTASISW